MTVPGGSVRVSVSHSVVSDSLQPHGLYPTRLLCPWDSPGKNTGVDCHSLPQGIFPTQGSNPGLQHCRSILYHLSHQESSKADYKVHKMGGGPVPGNPHPFPKTVRILVSLTSLWCNYSYENWEPHTLGLLSPSDLAHTVCGVCFSLNKSASYLWLCLSLSSFYDETSRPWASLSPEILGMCSQLKIVGSSPIWVTRFH